MKRFVSICLALIVLFTSCAKRNISFGGPGSKIDRLSKVKSLGLVTDVCYTKSYLFTKHVNVSDCKTAGTYFLKNVKELLQQNGYSVSVLGQPMVGSYLDRNYVYYTKPTKGVKRAPNYPPFFIDSLHFQDEDYLNSYANIMSGLLTLQSPKDTNSTVFSSDSLMMLSLKHIGENTNQRVVVCMLTNGIFIPSSLSIAEGVTIGLTVAVLTLGLFTFYLFHSTLFETRIAAVDVQTGEILWFTKYDIGGGNIAKEHKHRNWANKMFRKFPKVDVLLEK